MEIDKAIKEGDDRRLKTKYNSAIYVIQRALALYSYAPFPFVLNIAVLKLNAWSFQEGYVCFK